MPVHFKSIRIGWMFTLNGNRYIKKSSRTARLLEVDRTFYVTQKDICYL